MTMGSAFHRTLNRSHDDEVIGAGVCWKTESPWLAKSLDSLVQNNLGESGSNSDGEPGFRETSVPSERMVSMHVVTKPLGGDGQVQRRPPQRSCTP